MLLKCLNDYFLSSLFDKHFKYKQAHNKQKHFKQRAFVRGIPQPVQSFVQIFTLPAAATHYNKALKVYNYM